MAVVRAAVAWRFAFRPTVACGLRAPARTAGTVYLPLVSALDPPRARVQISNNRGRGNGWTGHARIYGICVAVDGVPCPGAEAKVRRPGTETLAKVN